MRGRVILTPLGKRASRGQRAVARLALLTRDARRYRDYFPRLRLIAPA